MSSGSRNFQKAEEFYRTGYWDEAEICYQKTVDDCDRISRPSRRQLIERSESLTRLHEIARAMHREDDSERLDSMLTGG
jgi:hypothetical protein